MCHSLWGKFTFDNSDLLDMMVSPEFVTYMKATLQGKDGTTRQMVRVWKYYVCAPGLGCVAVPIMHARWLCCAQFFARYGARDIHISHTGPVNRLKAVLFRVLRKPIMPHAHVSVSVGEGREVRNKTAWVWSLRLALRLRLFVLLWQVVIRRCDHETKQCHVVFTGPL